MKKLLYVSFENSENEASGVNKKIWGQMTAFAEEGFQPELIAIHGSNVACYHADRNKEIIKGGAVKRKTLCCWAASHAENYDVAYIRFQFFCPFVLHMVRALHKSGVKTVMEIPTYPYVPELKKQGIKGIYKRIIDATFRNACAKYIDSFAAPLYGENIMKKPCIEIRNGINVDEVALRSPQEHKEEIHLLAVAMMGPWHGYDRMIEGIHRYYSDNGTEKIVFHMAGEGAASQGYKELIDRYELSEHVIQHGQLFGEALNELYNLADIGVGSLGIHRTEVKKTNTLKVLEYLAKGLPVICEHSEVGIPETSEYRLTVVDDESPIDVKRIVEFYNSIYKDKDVQKLIDYIRDECKTNCNIKSGMDGVFNFLK